MSVALFQLPNVEIQWLRSNPLECRVRSARVKPARLANRCGLQRESAGATQSIGRQCASDNLGVNVGMSEIANLTFEVTALPEADLFDK